MAIEFIGTNSASVSGTAIRPTVPYPPGTQKGDVIVTVARSWNSELYDAWGADIRLVNSSRGGGNNLYILTETATGPNGSVMVEFNAGGNHHVTILVFRGVDPDNPTHAGMTAYDSTGTVHATPGLTTSIPDTVLVRAVATGLSGSSNSCSWAAPATERSDTRSSAGYSYISVATEPRPTPGAAGTVNATYTATAYGIMATIALRPLTVQRRMHLGANAVPVMLGGTEVEIAPSVPASAPSGGSGGALTDRTAESFTAVGWVSNYHVWAAHLNTSKPIGLLVYLHTNSGPEYDDPNSADILGGPNGIVARAKAKNMLVICPRAPASATWPYSVYETAHAGWLAGLIAHLRGQYNIDAHRTWFVAVQGGSQFLTRTYLPTNNASTTGGGAIVFRGGGENATELTPFSEQLLSRFSMHWLTGLADTSGVGGGQNAIEAALEGEPWYREQGFVTTIQTPPGAVDWTGTYGARVGAVLDAYLPE